MESPQAQQEALTEHAIINLTQEVGECGATRVHELPGKTLTIFSDSELFEFARKCAALSQSPQPASQPVVWQVSGRTSSATFSTKLLAEKYVQGLPPSVSGGMELLRIVVIGAPQPEPVDTKDAERYRWLRSIDSYSEWNRMGHYAEHALDKMVDAAIDAAMKDTRP